MTLDQHISTTLRQHPHLAGQRLHCETRDGNVTLRGTVTSYYQKQMAQEAVRRLQGVERIDNHLEVTWAVHSPDPIANNA